MLIEIELNRIVLFRVVDVLSRAHAGGGGGSGGTRVSRCGGGRCPVVVVRVKICLDRLERIVPRERQIQVGASLAESIRRRAERQAHAVAEQALRRVFDQRGHKVTQPVAGLVDFKSILFFFVVFKSRR